MLKFVINGLTELEDENMLELDKEKLLNLENGETIEFEKKLLELGRER